MTAVCKHATLRQIDGGRFRCEDCRTVLPTLTAKEALATARAALRRPRPTTKESKR